MPRRKSPRPAQAPPAAPAAPPRGGARWTFLSNHAHVLICLSEAAERTLREIAERVGITERAVQNIVSELEAEGLVERHREGRRNAYDLHLDQPLRHPIEAHCQVRDLVELVAGKQGPEARRAEISR